MKKYLIVLISIVLTSTITAGTTFYFVNKKSKKDKVPLENQVNELTNKIDALNRSSSLLGTKTEELIKANQDTTWKTYENKEFGFSFQYPDTFPSPTIDTPNIVTGSNIKKQLTISFKNLTPKTPSIAATVSLTVKQYDPENPVENLSFEGSTGQVNHLGKRDDISSRKDGFETSKSSDGTNIIDTPIQIKTVDNHKTAIFYFNFTPTNAYSKVAEIYYGPDKYIEFSAGRENTTPSTEFAKNPFITLTSGNTELDTLFLYFDQILPTFRFTQ